MNEGMGHPEILLDRPRVPRIIRPYPTLSGYAVHLRRLNRAPDGVMWYLIEDFFEQSLVMKAIIGWGWLSILIMVASIIFQ
jgi:hypothetical protein